MSEQNNLPSRPEQITKELAKSIFNLELAADGYQKFLQDAENIIFTPENLRSEHTALKRLREIRKKLDESREAKKKPLTAAGKAIQEAYNELDAPIKDILERKEAEFRKVNEQVKREQDEIDRQNRKTAEIKLTLQSFINTTTISITNAITDAEIVRIQKAIGTEKSRDGYYGSYIDELKTACDSLNPLINERKAAIRRKTELEKEIQSTTDQFKAVELMEEKDLLENEMNENAIKIKEKAFQQAASFETPVIESVAEVIPPRRQTWKWRVDDLQATFKKMPELVELVVNKEAIQSLIDSKKADKSLVGLEEFKLPGITLYLEKLY